VESTRFYGTEKEGEIKTGDRVDINFQIIGIRLEITNEAFEIVDVRGFKELGRTGYYLAQYKPRILDADDEFLLEFSEARGRLSMATNGLVSYN
jgi:hypothetical protein